ncbi:MAG: LysM peptidoglycan-binding domain-containing protein [Tepidisphaeraceae bacterium]
MTRETKIGLLVGLAFIIVIGILLSDHLTSSTEPPQAALAGAGNNVRQTVANPGGSNPAPATVAPPTNTSPQQQIPTPTELANRPQPVQIVNIGPGSAQHPQGPIAPPAGQNPQQVGAAQASAQPQQLEVAGADSPLVTQVPASGALADAARQNGEQLVYVDASGQPIQISPAVAPRSAGGVREYKAEPGDSVSRLAARFMGGNTRANRDAIIRANSALQQDPNKIIVGRTYLIPVAADSVVSNVNAAVQIPSQATQNPAVQREAGEFWYTVKEGDSLWRIATEQCGKASAVAAIKELNQDVLRGGDTLVPNMRLRLPAKPMIASN